MMTIDTALLAVFISIIITLVGVAFGYGMLTQKVKSTRSDLERECTARRISEDELKRVYEKIDNKLDDICDRSTALETKVDTLLRNGHKS